MCAIWIAYLSVPWVSGVMGETLFNKAESGSSVERLYIVYADITYFLQYPILGLGWGSAPTHDLIVGILANCGLIGLASFLLLLGYISNTLRKQQSAFLISGQIGNPANMMLLSLTAMFFTYCVSGPPTEASFWVILGLSVSALGLRETRTSSSMHGAK
jgi:hypothetical protein